jgi:hypothetical protein
MRSACIFCLASVSVQQFILVFHIVSILLSARPSQQTVTFSNSSSLCTDYSSSPCHQDWLWCWCRCCWQHLLLYFEVLVTKISQQVLPTAVLSCNFTQLPQYSHRPLLTTLFTCSVPRSPQQALCPPFHNTCLRSSKHCDAHRGRSSLLLTSHKKISRSNLWDESWKQTLLRVALLRKAHF